jgi:hypothetical protein
MKKNLFLLFSIYFFVVQPLIIGILRWQPNFFRLWAINLLAIILIALLYSTIEWGGEKEEVHHHERKPEPVSEAKVSFHEHFRAVVKERKKKTELPLPSIISFLVGLFFFFMFPYTSVSLAVIIFFSIIIWLLVFIILTILFKHRITKGFRSLIGTRIYLILLLCSIVYTWYDYYQAYTNYQSSIGDYLGQNFLLQEKIPTDGFVYTGEGTVLGTGLWSTTGTQTIYSDVFTGTTWTVQEATGIVLWTSTDTITGEQLITTTTTTIGNQKLMDAVIYLIKKYNVPLITSKDISFTYVTTKNIYYPERRTAYANKLIWKSTNPSKYIICDSYIVMKWILEKRPVTYTSATVLNKYRAEAINRNELNGCVKGKIVTDKTL